MTDKADIREEILQLSEEFKNCRRILQAFGDENRQHMIVEMLKMGRCGGVRVGEITEKTNLSRPAVSHHLKILKEAGIVKMRKEGTRNYYYFDTDNSAFDGLLSMLAHSKSIVERLPKRHFEKDETIKEDNGGA